MSVDQAILFRAETCAYQLTKEAMYHKMPPSYSYLPGEPLFEITQIFLHSIQKFADLSGFNRNDSSSFTKQFFTNNFPGNKKYETCTYPVEILWTAYALQDLEGRSPLSLFYSCTKDPIPFSILQQAKSVTEALKGFLNTANTESEYANCVQNFDGKWVNLLASLNQLQTSDKAKANYLSNNGGTFFKRYYRMKDFGVYSVKMQSDCTTSPTYETSFKNLTTLFLNSESCKKLPEFLAEWKKMPESLKENAANNDSFVRSFIKTLAIIKNLSFYIQETSKFPFWL